MTGDGRADQVGGGGRPHPAGPPETVREAYEQAPVVLGAFGPPPGYRFGSAAHVLDLIGLPWSPADAR